MELVLITSRYPYGKPEVFLEEELKTSERHFNKIKIISLEKSWKRNAVYIPANAEVIHARTGRVESCPLFLALFSFFKANTVRALLRTLDFLDFKKTLESIKKLFLFEYYSAVLFKTFKAHEITVENTLFYSYWMGVEAYFLYQFKKRNPLAYCVSRAHGYEVSLERGFQPYRKDIVRCLDEIHVVSEVGKDILAQLVGTPSKGNIFHSRLGVALHSNCLDTEKFYGKDDCFEIATCSSIIPLKRLDLLIASLRTLSCERKIRWTHYGSGSLAKNIMDLASRTLGARNIVLNFQGEQPNHVIIEAYQTGRFKLFINCSDSEGVPVSIMEAMGAGIPCLARNVGGMREIVDKNNGLLLSKDCKAEELTQAIEYFMNLPVDRYREYCVNAFNSIRKKYCSNTNYEDFYCSMLSRFRKRSDTTRIPQSGNTASRS